MKYDKAACDAAGLETTIANGHVWFKNIPDHKEWVGVALAGEEMVLITSRSAVHRFIKSKLENPSAPEAPGEYQPSTYGS